jgi:hypothetical protein
MGKVLGFQFVGGGVTGPCNPLSLGGLRTGGKKSFAKTYSMARRVLVFFVVACVNFREFQSEAQNSGRLKPVLFVDLFVAF